MAREGKPGTIKPLGNISCGINANEEKRYALLSRLLQRGEAMSRLLKTRTEPPAKGLQIIAKLFRCGLKDRVRHNDGPGRVIRKSPLSEASTILALETSLCEGGFDGVARLQMGELLGDLESAASSIQRLVQCQFLAMMVKPPHSARHHVPRKAPDPKPLCFLEERSYRSTLLPSSSETLSVMI